MDDPREKTGKGLSNLQKRKQKKSNFYMYKSHEKFNTIISDTVCLQ